MFNTDKPVKTVWFKRNFYYRLAYTIWRELENCSVF